MWILKRWSHKFHLLFIIWNFKSSLNFSDFIRAWNPATPTLFWTSTFRNGEAKTFHRSRRNLYWEVSALQFIKVSLVFSYLFCLLCLKQLKHCRYKISIIEKFHCFQVIQCILYLQLSARESVSLLSAF